MGWFAHESPVVKVARSAVWPVCLTPWRRGGGGGGLSIPWLGPALSSGSSKAEVVVCIIPGWDSEAGWAPHTLHRALVPSASWLMSHDDLNEVVEYYQGLLSLVSNKLVLNLILLSPRGFRSYWYDVWRFLYVKRNVSQCREIFRIDKISVLSHLTLHHVSCTMLSP